MRFFPAGTPFLRRPVAGTCALCRVARRRLRLEPLEDRRMLAISLATHDDFEDGTTAGWSEGPVSTNPPIIVSDGGPSGTGDSFLRNESSGIGGPGGRMAQFNVGEQWIGDYTAAGVTTFEAQLANFGDTPLNMRLAIATGPNLGPGRSTWFASTDAMVLPADGQWHIFTLELTDTGLEQVGGSGSLAKVLADVTEIRLVSSATPDFRGDRVAGILGVDDVRALGDLSSGWHNPENPFDVNAMNGTTPLDALLIINELTSRAFSDPSDGRLNAIANPPPFLDVNNDGFASPLDALLVINELPSGDPSSALASTAIVSPFGPPSVGNEWPSEESSRWEEVSTTEVDFARFWSALSDDDADAFRSSVNDDDHHHRCGHEVS